MTGRWGEKYQEYENREPYFFSEVIREKILGKAHDYSIIQQISIVPEKGSIISRCWRYNNVEERHGPCPHIAYTLIAERKAKKEHSMISTKMEICTQCYGKTWYVYLWREKHLIKTFQRKISKLEHNEWGSSAKLRADGKNTSNARR